MEQKLYKFRQKQSSLLEAHRQQTQIALQAVNARIDDHRQFTDQALKTLETNIWGD